MFFFRLVGLRESILSYIGKFRFFSSCVKKLKSNMVLILIIYVI